MFLDVAGSSGRSRSHNEDCPMGLGPEEAWSLVEMPKETGKGEEMFLDNSCSQIFPPVPPPTLPNWPDLSGNGRRGSPGSGVPGHSEKATIRAESGR